MDLTASSKLRDRIQAILVDPLFDEPAHDVTRDEVIWSLVVEYGWDAVREEMLSLLLDDAASRHWSVATTVIWRGIDQPTPVVRVIALLHLRLLADVPPDQALDENLVWSIVSNLKGVDYLSDYDPGIDPEVQDELAKMRAMDEPHELDDDELAKAPLPETFETPADQQDREALLAHIQVLRGDIARYRRQLEEIESGRGNPGANAAILRSALKHRKEHLALMEARLAEGA